MHQGAPDSAGRVPRSDKQNDKQNDKRADDDPDLAAVTEAWPDLPDAVKTGILAMVRAACPDRREGQSEGGQG